MAKNYSLELKQKPSQNLKQFQRLIMTQQMQQALHLLQMPVMELSAAIGQEIETNPILEYSQDPAVPKDDTEAEDQTPHAESDELDFQRTDYEVLTQLDENFQEHFTENGEFQPWSSEDEKRRTFMEASIPSSPSLFEYLMDQAVDRFVDPADLKIAEKIIGSLDENGYLQTSLHELAVLYNVKKKKLREVLAVVQTFEPYGIGAQDLREAMLIQMRCLGEKDSLAYKIVDEHFDRLVKNKIPLIQKKLHCSLQDISAVIENYLPRLNLHPGSWFARSPLQPIIPDLSITLEDDKLGVALHDDSCPAIKISGRYLKMLHQSDLPDETRSFIQQKIASGQWLMKSIMQRNDTLEKIGWGLIKHQQEFLKNPNGPLNPLTMKTLAHELGMHESTIARAVANKYIDTPRGVMSLRSFFTSSLDQTHGQEKISSGHVRELIHGLIEGEEKSEPLSDEMIAQVIQAKGIQCSRRTVAKYRGMLGLGNAQQRRKFVRTNS